MESKGLTMNNHNGWMEFSLNIHKNIIYKVLLHKRRFYYGVMWYSQLYGSVMSVMLFTRFRLLLDASSLYAIYLSVTFNF